MCTPQWAGSWSNFSEARVGVGANDGAERDVREVRIAAEVWGVSDARIRGFAAPSSRTHDVRTMGFSAPSSARTAANAQPGCNGQMSCVRIWGPLSRECARDVGERGGVSARSSKGVAQTSGRTRLHGGRIWEADPSQVRPRHISKTRQTRALAPATLWGDPPPSWTSGMLFRFDLSCTTPEVAPLHVGWSNARHHQSFLSSCTCSLFSRAGLETIVAHATSCIEVATNSGECVQL